MIEPNIFTNTVDKWIKTPLQHNNSLKLRMVPLHEKTKKTNITKFLNLSTYMMSFTAWSL